MDEGKFESALQQVKERQAETGDVDVLRGLENLSQGRFTTPIQTPWTITSYLIPSRDEARVSSIAFKSLKDEGKVSDKSSREDIIRQAKEKIIAESNIER